MDIGGKDKGVRELGSIITTGQSAEKRMLGSTGDDANISEPELSRRGDRNGEVHRGSVSGPSCVCSDTVHPRENSQCALGDDGWGERGPRPEED